MSVSALGLRMLRNLVCWMMVALTPVALLAVDVGAMLHGEGPVWLNGKTLSNASAVFPGDLIETNPESLATLDATGSSIVVFPSSLVKYAENAVSLQHGVLSVGTSQNMTAQAGTVTVTSVSNKWTEYELTDINGTIEVVARKAT